MLGLAGHRARVTTDASRLVDNEAELQGSPLTWTSGAPLGKPAVGPNTTAGIPEWPATQPVGSLMGNRRHREPRLTRLAAWFTRPPGSTPPL